ncbi:porin family protein [bacterium]|nr:MAG: porin family protein [bacterium]
MKATYVLFCMMFATNIVFSQDQVIQRKIGLSTSLQKEQLDISIPIRTSEYFVLAPSLKVIYVEDAGTEFGFGASVKRYFRNTKVAPYVTGRASLFGLESKTDDSSWLDFGFGLGLGADYFFDPNFSIGIEAQVNSTVSDKNSYRFGNPGGTNVNTATAITASIYFF